MTDLTHPFTSVLRVGGHRSPVVLGVVLLHIAGLWLLSEMPGAWRTAVAAQRAITVLLLDDTAKTQPLQVKTASQAMPPRANAPVFAPADTPVPVSPAPLTVQSSRDAGAADVQGTAPLNLHMSPGWSPQHAPRHPALDAGQGQRLPLTLERRLAGVLGDGQWTEERLGDGRLRLRNGNRCVYLQRNRSDELNPFNATPTPWTARAEAC